jgi:hypothetical protein
MLLVWSLLLLLLLLLLFLLPWPELGCRRRSQTFDILAF